MQLYKPIEKRDADGDKYLAYDEVYADFKGHKQPYTQEKQAMAYGIDMRYAHTVHTQSDINFSELDQIGYENKRYAIKVIPIWSDFKRLIVEEVRQ